MFKSRKTRIILVVSAFVVFCVLYGIPGQIGGGCVAGCQKAPSSGQQQQNESEDISKPLHKG